MKTLGATKKIHAGETDKNQGATEIFLLSGVFYTNAATSY